MFFLIFSLFFLIFSLFSLIFLTAGTQKRDQKRRRGLHCHPFPHPENAYRASFQKREWPFAAPVVIKEEYQYHD
jgi:hypothetical protein